MIRREPQRARETAVLTIPVTPLGFRQNLINPLADGASKCRRERIAFERGAFFILAVLCMINLREETVFVLDNPLGLSTNHVIVKLTHSLNAQPSQINRPANCIPSLHVGRPIAVVIASKEIA